jgi:hypothetical protein
MLNKDFDQDDLGPLIKQMCFEAIQQYFQNEKPIEEKKEKELYSMKELCIYFEKSRTTINAWIKKGLFTATKIGGCLSFNISEVKASIYKFENPISSYHDSSLQQCKDKWKYLDINSKFKDGVIPSVQDLMFYKKHCELNNLPDLLN